MAMILELEDLQGHRTRHRVDALPVTIGRSCVNDLIVDDPHADAVHARLSCGPGGEIVVDDLGSVNGLGSGGARQQQVVLHPGAAIHVGRTVLRLRDPQEALPPAIPVMPPSAVPGPRQQATLPAAAPRADVALVPGGTLARLLIVLSAVGAAAAYTWLHSYERSSAGQVLAVVFAVLAGGALWAGIWAVAGRANVQRFQFTGHFTITCAAILVMLADHSAGEWITFVAPDTVLQTILSSGVELLVVAAAVAAHLSLSSTMTAVRRWRAGAIAAVTLLALTGLNALAKDDGFTDVPKFSAVLKPVPVQWLPTATVDEFGRLVLELKEEVDGLAAAAGGPDGSSRVP